MATRSESSGYEPIPYNVRNYFKRVENNCGPGPEFRGVMKLQSVELRVADVGSTAEFFEKVWGLTPVGSAKLRGTAGLPYLIGLEQGKPSIRSITFCGTRAEIGKEREVKGPDGETYRFVVETSVAPLPAERDRPIQLSHVVLNSADADAAARCAVEPPGFKPSAPRRHMNSVRWNPTHHCTSYAPGRWA